MHTLVWFLMICVVQKCYAAFGSSEGTEFMMQNTRRPDFSKAGVHLTVKKHQTKIYFYSWRPLRSAAAASNRAGLPALETLLENTCSLCAPPRIEESVCSRTLMCAGTTELLPVKWLMYPLSCTKCPRPGGRRHACSHDRIAQIHRRMENAYVQVKRQEQAPHNTQEDTSWGLRLALCTIRSTSEIRFNSSP